MRAICEVKPQTWRQLNVRATCSQEGSRQVVEHDVCLPCARRVHTSGCLVIHLLVFWAKGFTLNLTTVGQMMVDGR